MRPSGAHKWQRRAGRESKRSALQTQNASMSAGQPASRPGSWRTSQPFSMRHLKIPLVHGQVNVRMPFVKASLSLAVGKDIAHSEWSVLHGDQKVLMQERERERETTSGDGLPNESRHPSRLSRSLHATCMRVRAHPRPTRAMPEASPSSAVCAEQRWPRDILKPAASLAVRHLRISRKKQNLPKILKSTLHYTR